MPKAVAQKRKTTVATDITTGASAGRVTVRSTCQGLAPSEAAACSRRGSSCDHHGPTARTTSERLKKTRAATIATGVPSSPREPSGPEGASSPRKATPTTTVGSTKGAVTRTRSARLPGNRRQYSAYAVGTPSATVTTVASAEVHAVNHSTCRTRGRVRVSATWPSSQSPSGRSPRFSIPSSGTTTKTVSTAAGTTAVATASSRGSTARPGLSPRSGRSIP